MKKWSEQKNYVYIALLFGILFVFLTPPFQSPDEDSHFKKTYQISKGHLYPVEKENKLGNYFPREMIKYIDDKRGYIGKLDKKYSYSKMFKDQYYKMNYHKQGFHNYSTATVLPITYTAPAIGIIFGKVCARIFALDMVSTTFMLYFARIFSLIATVIITYFAIKRTPVMKKTFLVVSLLPMTLFLSSMVSYDNLLNSITLLALAIILDLIYEKDKVDKKDSIPLALIGVILLNVKTIYFLIFILMLAIPYKKFGTKKDKIKTAVILIASILLITLVLKLPQMFKSVFTSDQSSQQISFILSHPFTYSKILIKNILGQRLFQLNSMVGVFGLIDTYSPFAIIILTYLNLFATSISDAADDKKKIGLNVKILSIIYVILGIVGVFTALYVMWTPGEMGKIGTSNITGVQGRYFIPLIMPLLLIFSTKKIKDNKVFKIVRENYLLIPIILLTISVSVIVLRFWV